MPKTKPQEAALKNRLLDALPAGEFKKIRPSLELVDLAAGDVLWEAEEKRQHIYFPTTALICLLYDSDEGVSVEAGIAGCHGLVGVSTFMSGAGLTTRAMAVIGGEALRMKASDVKSEFSECGDFQEICMYYTEAFIAQISQTAICNRLHSVDQQICRFLLYLHDHKRSKNFAMTHDQIAQVLGVRRETVSLGAGQLQNSGLIEYSRGKIKMLDRKGIENTACECYRVETDHYKRVLGKYISKHR
jgi:CRP-like cAMP-binding protein